MKTFITTVCERKTTCALCRFRGPAGDAYRERVAQQYRLESASWDCPKRLAWHEDLFLVVRESQRNAGIDTWMNAQRQILLATHPPPTSGTPHVQLLPQLQPKGVHHITIDDDIRKAGMDELHDMIQRLADETTRMIGEALYAEQQALISTATCTPCQRGRAAATIRVWLQQQRVAANKSTHNSVIHELHKQEPHETP